MEYKKLFSLLLSVGLAGSWNVLPAAELEPVEIDEWTGTVNRLSETELGKADEFVLLVTGSAELFSADLLKIDPGKKYKLTGEFMATADSLPGILYFGVVPFDADGKQILPGQVHIASGTDTVLAAPVKAADRVIKVKDAGHWKPGALRCIAFHTDASGNFKDLPNRNVTRHGVEKIEKLADGTWEVWLSNPAGMDFPADTPVRQHEIAGEYNYVCAAGTVIPKEWTKYEQIISGEQLYGVDNRHQWWHGTRQAKIVALVNYAGDVGHKALMKNIKLSSIEETAQPEAKPAQ